MCWSTRVFFSVALVLPALLPASASAQPSDPDALPRLTDEQVAQFARLALDGIVREYPNKPSNVITGPERVLGPRQLYPVFYGSFDWHSAVHGHWLLVRLLKEYPGSSIDDEARELLSKQFDPVKLAAEAEHFRRPENRSFERMYGWAWALRLAAELRTWDDPQGRAWADAFRPLEETLVERVHDYLPKLDWPIRTGVHPDTGFALAQILDYAVEVGDEELEQLVRSRALDYYRSDHHYPTLYEPSGEDFFSSGLNEADLMRRVLPPTAYSTWLGGFFPTLVDARLGEMLNPADVSDVTDGKIVHLAGLNFNRAWTMRGIALALPEDDPRRAILLEAARQHIEAGMRYVFSGHYEGEHWLASFAVYVLTRTGEPQ